MKQSERTVKGLITKIDEANEPQGRKVVIMRHGQTLLNAQDKIRAWIDVPLDETGVQQAEELGEALLESQIELDGIYSSDLLRAVQTSLEVSKMTGIPIIGTTKGLRPWDVGELSGTDGEKAHAIMMKYAYEYPDEPVGKTGESFNIFKYRVLSSIISLLNSHRGLLLGLVSHSRGERILHAWVEAGCPEDLSVDLEEFGRRGEGTATAQELVIECPLVLS